eukprot:2680772-Prymnesium_polylepis.1
MYLTVPRLGLLLAVVSVLPLILVNVSSVKQGSMLVGGGDGDTASIAVISAVCLVNAVFRSFWQS